MLIDELLKVLPRPSKPLNVPKQIIWEKVEAELKTTLPEDYKRFIELYGTGVIGNELWILNPFSKQFNLKQKSESILSGLKCLRNEFPEEYGFSFYPEPEGLLPCGVTNNADTLFWVTKDRPDKWTLLLMEARSYEYEKYDDGLSNFLIKLVKNELGSDILASPPFDSTALFRLKPSFEVDK